MSNTETAARWHKLVVDTDGAVSVDGEHLDVEDAFTHALGIFAAEAKSTGADVLVHSTDEGTSTANWFTVDGEGQLNPATAPVEAAPAAQAVKEPLTFATAAKRSPEDLGRRLVRPRVSQELPPLEDPAKAAAPAVADVPAPALASLKSLRDSTSFLEVEEHVAPALKGWQGRMNGLGLGLRLAPGAVELAEREDEHLVARTYPGPRTIAVVNQKGGASKTPTVVNLASTFGRAGLTVCAWDNNESTGSMWQRIDCSDHRASALHVIARAEQLLADTARAADIGGFVHRQTRDKFDALLSDQDIDGEHEISAAEVDTIHAVLSRYYNLIIMDTGNNHRASNWRRTIEHADQLVVPMTTAKDRVESARLTLQGLARRDERSAKLTENAVVIVSEEQKGRRDAALAHAEKFREYVREVVIIPFDEALTDGVIRHDALQPATQRAWLAATAAVAKGL